MTSTIGTTAASCPNLAWVVSTYQFRTMPEFEYSILCFRPIIIVMTQPIMKSVIGMEEIVVVLMRY